MLGDREPLEGVRWRKAKVRATEPAKGVEKLLLCALWVWEPSLLGLARILRKQPSVQVLAPVDSSPGIGESAEELPQLADRRD
jgi:hypothetical protein